MADQQTMVRAPENLAAGLVTDSMIDEFQTIGAVAVRGLLDSHWIEQLRGQMDHILSDSYLHTPERRGNTDMWLKNETFKRLMFESPLAAAAAALMQSNIARYYEDILIYVAQGAAEGKASWHQDAPFWPFTGRQLSNVWFSLERVTSATGALRIVSGSHRGPHYYPSHLPLDREAEADFDRHLWTGGPLPDIDADPARFPVVTIETEPGDVVIFHPAALHMGHGTPVAGPRRTFTIRMWGDDVRWLPKRSLYHAWMRELTFSKGDVPEHPRFPLLWPR